MPEATRRETRVPCQKEKKIMPFTQRNLGIGLKVKQDDYARGKVDGEGCSPEWLEVIVNAHPEHS